MLNAFLKGIVLGVGLSFSIGPAFFALILQVRLYTEVGRHMASLASIFVLVLRLNIIMRL